MLNYEDAGDGTGLLLLHAGVCDLRMWNPQWAPWSERFHAVRCDLRGFGGSPIPDHPYVDIDDLTELLDYLEVERATVVGSSYGGRIALELATHRPGRVASLLLLNPAYRGLEPTPTAEKFDEAEEALLEAGDIAAAVDLNVRTWVGPAADDATRAQVAEMQRRAFEIQLAAEDAPGPEPREVDPTAIEAPTLIVTGERDMDHFQAVAAHLAAAIPRARLVTLPWAAHLPSLERPDEITRLLPFPPTA